MGEAPKRATHLLLFIVVDIPFDYCVLFGRPGINQFRAIPSTFHNKMKFPTPYGVGEIVGDRKTAWKCYSMSTRHCNQEPEGELMVLSHMGGLPDVLMMENGEP